MRELPNLEYIDRAYDKTHGRQHRFKIIDPE